MLRFVFVTHLLIIFKSIATINENDIEIIPQTISVPVIEFKNYSVNLSLASLNSSFIKTTFSNSSHACLVKYKLNSLA